MAQGACLLGVGSIVGNSDKLDCQDHGCLMVEDLSGMRTNGGKCRCLDGYMPHDKAQVVYQRVRGLLQERRQLLDRIAELEREARDDLLKWALDIERADHAERRVRELERERAEHREDAAFAADIGAGLVDMAYARGKAEGRQEAEEVEKLKRVAEEGRQLRRDFEPRVRALRSTTMVATERELLPCDVCGVDRCELCHVCTQRTGEGFLSGDCECDEDHEPA